MFTQRELEYLEKLINEEIYEYLDGGYKLSDEHVVTLRGMLKKLDLNEIYDFERIGEANE